MGIGIRNFKLTQPTNPLKVGVNIVTIDFIGIVDNANENDVTVTATIDDDAPIVFTSTGTKVTTYKQKFPIGDEGACNNSLSLSVTEAFEDSAAAQITIVYKTVQGKRRTRFPSVIY